MSKFYNNLKTVMFMGALTALILVIGHLLGRRRDAEPARDLVALPIELREQQAVHVT